MTAIITNIGREVDFEAYRMNATINQKFKILTLSLFLVLLNMKPSISVENVTASCVPEYFDEITVNSKEIVIVYRHGYTDKFVIKPNKEIQHYLFDKEGKEVRVYKSDSIYAYIGEEMGEHLELREWNGQKASFKLKKVCAMPACEQTQTRECIITIKDCWKKPQR